MRSPQTGEPVSAGYVVREECTALDVTHPGAARYLTDVLSTMREWGIDYFKVDFAYAGACEGLRQEDVSGVEAYRRGLRPLRAAGRPPDEAVGGQRHQERRRPGLAARQVLAERRRLPLGQARCGAAGGMGRDHPAIRRPAVVRGWPGRAGRLGPGDDAAPARALSGRSAGLG